MTFSQRDVVLVQREKDKRFQPAEIYVPAKIISVGGSTVPSTEPNKVWVQRDGVNLDVGKALNPLTLTTAGTPVLLSYSRTFPHQWVIIGTYDEEAAPGTTAISRRLNVGEHAKNHQYPSESSPGPDPVLIYQPAMTMLKVEGDGSTLIVNVFPLIYTFEGVRQVFDGSTLDLTSYVPGAGLTRRVLVYLDPDSNALAVVSGTTVSSSGALPVPYPDEPRRAIAAAYVQLTNAQTAITTATHIDDARSILKYRPDYAIPLRWSWADSTARAAETDVTQSDVDNYRLGLQVDTGVLYRATATTPTWSPVGGGTLLTETAKGFSITSGSSQELLFKAEHYGSYAGSDYATRMTPYNDNAESRIESGFQYANDLKWKNSVLLDDVTITGNGNTLNIGGASEINQNVSTSGEPSFVRTETRSIDLPSVGAAPTLSKGSMVVLSGATTDATPTELFVQDVTNSRITLPTGTVITFLAIVSARRSDADNEAHGWLLHGSIDNNSGTVAMVTTPTELVDAGDGAGVWDISATADNTNKALVFTATGENSKNIDWQLFVMFAYTNA